MMSTEVLFSCLLLTVCMGEFGAEDIITIEDQCSSNYKLLELKTSSAKTVYHLMTAERPYSLFSIKTDALYSNQVIDIDTLCSTVEECCDKEKDKCEFSITVAEQDSASEVRMRKIKIVMKDKNDNYPIFLTKDIEIELSENLKTGYIIKLPLATDNDFGTNRIDKYDIINPEPRTFDQYFRLNVIKETVPVKVELKLNKPLDREAVSKYSFKLIAVDGPNAMHTGSTNIVLRILDENDNMPQFEKSFYKESVKEGYFHSMPIIKLKAMDPDENYNGKILYKFDSNSQNDPQIQDNFIITEETGEIFLKRALDYEKQNSFKFVIIAVNPTPSTPIGLPTSSASVEISVDNVYDEHLEINVDYLSSKNYSLVEENNSNVFVAVVTVKSREANLYRSSIHCYLDSYKEVLNINLKTEDNYKFKSYEVRTIAEIDREILPKIETKIICKDSSDSGMVTAAPLNILIVDQNDNAPQLSIMGDKFVKENTPVGTVVLRINAIDKDEGENGRISFSMEKSSPPSMEFLSIGETDGIIRVKSYIDCEANIGPLTTLSIIVTATDHGNLPKSTDLPFNIEVIDVNDNPPKFPNSVMRFSVSENAPPHSIGEIEVDDRDVKDEIFLDIINHNPGSFPFIIFRKSKRLFFLNTTRSLDMEKENKFEFNVIASNFPNMRQNSATGSVLVEVLDLNDNPPIIIFPPQNNISIHYISYHEQINYKFMTVSANDQDQSKPFSDVQFHIEGVIDIFDIDRLSGQIFTCRAMHKGDMGEQSITVTASNTAIPNLKSSVVINVVIDNSAPKSGGMRTDNNQNYDSGNLHSTGPFNFDILIIIFIALLVIIFIIVGLVAFKYYNHQSMCLQNTFDKCYRSENLSLGSQVYVSNIKMKNEIDLYKDQNPRLSERSTMRRDSVDDWMPSNNFVDVYHPSTTPSAHPKHGYTHLSNLPQYCIHPPTYQTIDDADMAKYHELNKFMFMNRGKYETNYKSELNLNSDNLFYEQNQELSQINEPQKMKWMSLSQMPTRSKSVVNRVIPNEQTENSFAVVYPQEQSTFV